MNKLWRDKIRNFRWSLHKAQSHATVSHITDSEQIDIMKIHLKLTLLNADNFA